MLKFEYYKGIKLDFLIHDDEIVDLYILQCRSTISYQEMSNMMSVYYLHGYLTNDPNFGPFTKSENYLAWRNKQLKHWSLYEQKLMLKEIVKYIDSIPDDSKINPFTIKRLFHIPDVLYVIYMLNSMTNIRRFVYDEGIIQFGYIKCSGTIQSLIYEYVLYMPYGSYIDPLMVLRWILNFHLQVTIWTVIYYLRNYPGLVECVTYQHHVSPEYIYFKSQ